QRPFSEPSWLFIFPIWQNSSAEISCLWEKTHRVPIGRNPSRPEPHVVVSKEKDISSKIRDRPVPCVGEPLLTFFDLPDWQPVSKCFHHLGSIVDAVVVDDENLDLA